MSKQVKIIILIYSLSSFFLIIPIVVLEIFNPTNNLPVISEIRNLMIFKVNLISIIFLLLVLTTILLLDIFFFNDKETFQKNCNIYSNLFGKKKNITVIILVSIFSGLFEELLFRGYLYELIIFLIPLKQIFIIIDILVITILSILFGFLHISQGKAAALFSGIASIVFFISIKLSSTIWYAVIFHSLFNFVQLFFITPFLIKKMALSNEYKAPSNGLTK